MGIGMEWSNVRETETSSRSQPFQLGQAGRDLPVVRHHSPLPIAGELGLQCEQVVLDVQQGGWG